MTDFFKKLKDGKLIENLGKLGNFLSFKETYNSENIKETKDTVRNSNYYFEILKI